MDNSGKCNPSINKTKGQGIVLFRETGHPGAPVVILLHGGGLSWWSWEQVTRRLKSEYRVVMPAIDGHGEDGAETFLSIEDSALKLISYIDEHCDGSVSALCGLSLGAQIALEVLGRRPDITSCAIIESALVYPMRVMTPVSIFLDKLAYPLMRKRWFARAQAKTLCLPEELFERYYADSLQMSRQTLINITKSNGTYEIKPSLAQTSAKICIAVGQKEIPIMKRSARTLHEVVMGSILHIAGGMKHGELSLTHPDEYVDLLSQVMHSKKARRS